MCFPLKHQPLLLQLYVGEWIFNRLTLTKRLIQGFSAIARYAAIGAIFHGEICCYINEWRELREGEGPLLRHLNPALLQTTHRLMAQ